MVKIETRCRMPIWRTFGRIPWHVILEPRITLQVLPLGKFTVMIPEPHATLQGVVILSAILIIRFSLYSIFCFFKCSLGFDERRLSVSDTLVMHVRQNTEVTKNVLNQLSLQYFRLVQQQCDIVTLTGYRDNLVSLTSDAADPRGRVD